MRAQIARRRSGQGARLTAANIGEHEARERRLRPTVMHSSDSLWADFLTMVSVATAVVIVIYMISIV